MKAIVPFMAVSLVLPGGWANGQEPTRAELAQRYDFYFQLKSLGSTALTFEPSSAQLGGALMAVESGEPGTAMPALLQLWLAGEATVLDLQWWKKHARAPRMLIVALAMIDDATVQSEFERQAARFNQPEESERREEIAFVKARLPSIAKMLQRSLADAAGAGSERGKACLKKLERSAKESGGAILDENAPNLPDRIVPK